MIVNYTDHSANERTFLAWVRTSIAVVGFGMAAARLGDGQPQFWTEILMLVAGATVVFLAFLRMRRIKARISAAEMLDGDAIPTDTLLLVLVAALFALLATFALHVG
jgi:putative membrane protein